MGYSLDAQESIPGRGKRFLPSPQRPHQLQGPYSLLYHGYQGALSPGMKWPGRKTDHSPTSNAEVKNYGATPLLPINTTLLSLVSIYYSYNNENI
jgi:hypothetical protein